jgi:hypothetical protein
MATWDLWKAVASSNHFGGEQPAASAEGRRNGSDPATHGESRKSEKSPREYRAAIGGNIGGAQRTFLWSKALRLRKGEHFGERSANSGREGTLETGRSTTEEGNTSKGEAPVRRVGRSAETSAVGSKPGGPHGR